MKKSMLITIAAALALVGCQTRITAEKFPERGLPIEEVVKVNGEDRVITKEYQIASGGWYATARSPLWATEALSGLDLGVSTNGTVFLRLEDYSRDLSTNAVLVVNSLSELAADVAGKVAAAVCAYYGGGAVSATSKLGEMTIKDITGRVQAKIAKRGLTDATAKAADAAAIAKEVCEECVADCSDGSCSPQAQ